MTKTVGVVGVWLKKQKAIYSNCIIVRAGSFAERGCRKVGRKHVARLTSPAGGAYEVFEAKTAAQKKSLKYTMTSLVNEYGSGYGFQYTIECAESEFVDKQAELIESVIGEERYYGSRDVWDQIVIDRK